MKALNEDPDITKGYETIYMMSNMALSSKTLMVVFIYIQTLHSLAFRETFQGSTV